MSVGVQNSALMSAGAGELLGSAGHNPEPYKGAFGRGGHGTPGGAVVEVTTGRAHCLVHRVRKRCGKKKGEVRPTRMFLRTSPQGGGAQMNMPELLGGGVQTPRSEY